MTSSTPIDVTEIMREIRDRLRHKPSVAPPVAFPVVNVPLSNALHGAHASVSQLRTLAEQIDKLPPQPQTLRGTIGAFLSRLVRRILFWQYAQARSLQISVTQTIEHLLTAADAAAAQGEHIEASLRNVAAKIKHLTDNDERIEAAESTALKAIQRLHEDAVRCSYRPQFGTSAYSRTLTNGRGDHRAGEFHQSERSIYSAEYSLFTGKDRRSGAFAFE